MSFYQYISNSGPTEHDKRSTSGGLPSTYQTEFSVKLPGLETLSPRLYKSFSAPLPTFLELGRNLSRSFLKGTRRSLKLILDLAILFFK